MIPLTVTSSLLRSGQFILLTKTDEGENRKRGSRSRFSLNVSLSSSHPREAFIVVVREELDLSLWQPRQCGWCCSQVMFDVVSPGFFLVQPWYSLNCVCVCVCVWLCACALMCVCEKPQELAHISVCACVCVCVCVCKPPSAPHAVCHHPRNITSALPAPPTQFCTPGCIKASNRYVPPHTHNPDYRRTHALPHYSPEISS